MPKDSSNDELIREHKEGRRALIQMHSRQAAEQIVKQFESKRKPSVEQIAELIAAEFLQLPG